MSDYNVVDYNINSISFVNTSALKQSAEDRAKELSDLIQQLLYQLDHGQASYDTATLTKLFNALEELKQLAVSTKSKYITMLFDDCHQDILIRVDQMKEFILQFLSKFASGVESMDDYDTFFHILAELNEMAQFQDKMPDSIKKAIQDVLNKISEFIDYKNKDGKITNFFEALIAQIAIWAYRHHDQGTAEEAVRKAMEKILNIFKSSPASDAIKDIINAAQAIHDNANYLDPTSKFAQILIQLGVVKYADGKVMALEDDQFISHMLMWYRDGFAKWAEKIANDFSIRDVFKNLDGSISGAAFTYIQIEMILRSESLYHSNVAGMQSIIDLINKATQIINDITKKIPSTWTDKDVQDLLKVFEIFTMFTGSFNKDSPLVTILSQFEGVFKNLFNLKFKGKDGKEISLADALMAGDKVVSDGKTGNQIAAEILNTDKSVTIDKALPSSAGVLNDYNKVLETKVQLKGNDYQQLFTAESGLLKAFEDFLKAIIGNTGKNS
jgi:hypothetical protein